MRSYITLLITLCLNFVMGRDFYVGMFKKNDILVAQDRIYKERVPYRIQYATYGRHFKCAITYFRVVDRLGIGTGPKVAITRGGLRYKYIVLKIRSMYNKPISVNIYVGCENRMRPTLRPLITTPAAHPTTDHLATTTSGGDADGSTTGDNAAESTTSGGGDEATSSAPDGPENPDAPADDKKPKVTLKSIVVSGTAAAIDAAETTFECDECTLDVADIKCGEAPAAADMFAVADKKITLNAIAADAFKDEMACVYMGAFKKGTEALDAAVVAVIENGDVTNVKLEKQTMALSDVPDTGVAVAYECPEAGNTCKIGSVTQNGVTLGPEKYTVEPLDAAAAGTLTILKGANEGVYQAVFEMTTAPAPNAKITKTVLEITS